VVKFSEKLVQSLAHFAQFKTQKPYYSVFLNFLDPDLLAVSL